MKLPLSAAALALLVHAAGAPFQCASDPDPERAMEDSPPSALWELAERFREEGDADARRDTLRFLVERYPSSRYARRAEQALRGGDEPPADPGIEPPEPDSD